MLRHRLGDNSSEFFNTDNITQKKVSDDERNSKEYYMLDCLLKHFAARPFLIGQHFLSGGITFYEIFNFPEQHFHEYRLRADPSAKQPSEGGGEQDDKHDERNHRKTEYEKVLWPEHLTENDEFGFGD